jgi:hypothetical protein
VSDHIHLIDTGETDHGRAVFELEHSYQYSWPLYVDRPGNLDSRNRVAVHVPAGFRTDFASIPRMFWRIFNPAGKWRRAALVHDYLYSRAANCPRFLADAIFRHIMEQDGVRWCSRVIIYYAVRLFARRGYHRR